MDHFTRGKIPKKYIREMKYSLINLQIFIKLDELADFKMNLQAFRYGLSRVNVLAVTFHYNDRLG